LNQFFLAIANIRKGKGNFWEIVGFLSLVKLVYFCGGNITKRIADTPFFPVGLFGFQVYLHIFFNFLVTFKTDWGSFTLLLCIACFNDVTLDTRWIHTKIFLANVESQVQRVHEIINGDMENGNATGVEERLDGDRYGRQVIPCHVENQTKNDMESTKSEKSEGKRFFLAI
jgi:hypothetical protein